jgi:nucleoside-diphosphate-sugar epimerase
VKGIKRVLITGATGFIGSHLVNRLVKEGFRIGIMKRKTSDTWRIENLIKKIEIYEGDLKENNTVMDVISDFKPEAVAHLATYYSVEHKPKEISEMFSTNVMGTINLLEACSNSCVKLFLNTSTCFVFMKNAGNPGRDSEAGPVNLYALTKKYAEDACTYYAKKCGLNVVTLRLFPPYGPRDNDRKLVPYVIKNMLAGDNLKMTSGKQKWDYIFVNDIIEAFEKVFAYRARGHEIFNIGTGRAYSVRDLVYLIGQNIGSVKEPEWGAIPHRKNEIWYMKADIKRSRIRLKWKPNTDLEKGMSTTVKWYKDFYGGDYGSKN